MTGGKGGQVVCDGKEAVSTAWVAFAVLLCPWSVAAEEVSHLSLDTLVVSDRTDTDITATMIGPKILERGSNFNLADAIMKEPDITVTRRSRVGDYSDNLSIRGFSGNRILLNINDRPVNTAGVGGGYYIDWNLIQLDNVERIEITRGGSSVRYANTLGGIINVITRTPTETPEFSFAANYGSGAIDNMSTLRVAHAYKSGPVGYLVGASYQRADAFLWNNDFEGKNANVQTSVDMPAFGMLSFGFQYANSVVGLIRNNRNVDQLFGDPEDPTEPGYNEPINPAYPPVTGVYLFPTIGHSFIPGTGSYVDKTRKYYDVGYMQPIGDGVLTAKVYWNDEMTTDRNFASCDLIWWNGNDPCDRILDGALVLEQTTNSDRSRGARLEYLHRIGRHRLLAGIDAHDVRFGNKHYGYFDTYYNNPAGPFFPFDYPGYTPSTAGENRGLFFEDSWQMTDRFLLSAGFRYDTVKLLILPGSDGIPPGRLPPGGADEWGFLPKVTGTFLLGSRNTLTLSAYEAMRAPAQTEMYWWANATDPAARGRMLTSEHSRALEATWQHRLERGQLRLSAWYYSVDDYLMLRFDPGFFGAYNIDKATFAGVTVDGRMNLNPWLNLSASFAFQQTRKDGDIFDPDNAIEGINYIPEWKAFAGAEIRLPRGARWDLNLIYTGEREGMYAYGGFGRPVVQAPVRIGDYLLLGSELKFPLDEHIMVGLFVENLFDVSYEEQFGYPMPGRIFGVDFRATF